MAPRGGIRTADKLFIQASLSMGITPQREVEEKRLKKKRGGEGKVLCQYLISVPSFFSYSFKHLLSSTLRYSIEDDRAAD